MGERGRAVAHDPAGSNGEARSRSSGEKADERDEVDVLEYERACMRRALAAFEAVEGGREARAAVEEVGTVGLARTIRAEEKDDMVGERVAMDVVGAWRGKAWSEGDRRGGGP